MLETGRAGEDLMFGRTKTTVFAPMTIDKRARKAWKNAGLEPISVHARHTLASLLIDSGAKAKATQEFVGHKKITTTYDTYGDLLPGSRDEIRLGRRSTWSSPAVSRRSPRSCAGARMRWHLRFDPHPLEARES
jgi:integrase